jgi:predicted RNase H-like nuclease (RuvC/YqgF family)
VQSLIVIIILVEVVVILGVVLGVCLNKIKKLKRQLNTAPVVVENAAHEEKDTSSERVKANDTVEENDDASSSEYLFEQQSKTIEHLKEFISSLLSNIDPKALPNKELDSHFEKLEQDNIQLVHCVAILEDENGFLRDQIEALLKLEK